MLTHYMNDSQHYGKWKEPVLEDQKDVEDQTLQKQFRTDEYLEM